MAAMRCGSATHTVILTSFFRFLVWFRRVLGLSLALAVMAPMASGQSSIAPENYRLGPGDSIKVTVFQNPDMLLDTRVSEDGAINYPLVGRIVVGGLEIGAAEKKIAQALKDGGILKSPQLNIQVLEVRGNTVAVLGQVNKSGSYPLNTTTRISQMLAQAGGQTQTGDDRVIVTGTRSGKPFRRVIDIDALYRGQQGDDDVVLAAGDTIYVPRAPMFYIYGEITRPGNYRIDRGMTMRQAIAAGGGLTLRGTERRLRVVRPNTNAVSEKVPVELDDPVQPGDVIYVAESLF